ncbi:glycosyltransferase [Vibrio cyclitrophicus]
MNVAFMMCVYKGDDPDYIADCLRSIESQSFININVNIRVYIHIDGVIPKQHLDVISEFDIYKKIFSKKPVGLACGLNRIISELEDERYYFRMDADDIMFLDRVEKQVTFMESNSDVEVSGGSIYEFVGNIDNVVHRRDYPLSNEMIRKTSFRACPLAHVSVCFRGGFFLKYGSYPTSYPFNEDIAYWVKLIKENVVFANILEPLVYVRMDSAYSRRGINKMKSEFLVYLRHNLSHGKLTIWPFARVFLRLLPVSLTAFLYSSKVRSFFTR